MFNDILTIVFFIISLVVGVFIFKAGKDLQNKNLKNAGLLWIILNALVIISLCLFMFLFSVFMCVQKG